VAVIETPAERVAEDHVMWCFERRGEPALSQKLADRERQDDFAPACLGLERAVYALRGELAADADYPGLVVDVSPGQPERLADAQAGVGKKLEQRPARAGVGKEAGEFVAFEDRCRLGRPVRLLGGFELSDRVICKPASANGKAADLVDGDPRRVARISAP
jgi:hypothetical protein